MCTTVAIAIVAETCSPFTVLPALMNEYRVPELNIQNGVLKSLAFLFEYIGEMGKDYIYAVTPLLEAGPVLGHRRRYLSFLPRHRRRTAFPSRFPFDFAPLPLSPPSW